MSGRTETSENEGEETIADTVNLGEKIYNKDGEILEEIRRKEKVTRLFRA